MIGNKQLAQLQRSRQRGLSRLLLLARRNFLTRVSASLETSGLPAVPDACVMVLPYIDLEGTRSTVIAQRAGTTRQAVSQVVAVLEQLGLVKKHVDEADARALIVAFTPAGLDYLVQMHAVIDRIEQEIAQSIGNREMEIVRRTLELMAYGRQGG